MNLIHDDLRTTRQRAQHPLTATTIHSHSERNNKHTLLFSEAQKVSIWGKSGTSRSSFPSGGYWCQFVWDPGAPALMWPHGCEHACRECSQHANESKNGRIEIYFRGKKENRNKKDVTGMTPKRRGTEGRNTSAVQTQETLHGHHPLKASHTSTYKWFKDG